MSKKLEDKKLGNLLVSVVRKVMKEEQSDSSMGVETDNKEGFKDIVKAADDFCLKGRFWKRSRQRQNPQGQRERKFPSKRNIADQKQEQGKSQGKKRKDHTVKQNRWKGSQKTWYLPRQNRVEEHSKKVGRKTQEKRRSKGQNNDDRSGGKAKKGQK